MLPKNRSHNVLAHIKWVKHSLAGRTIVYLMTKAAGQSHVILEAKQRDLHVICAHYNPAEVAALAHGELS